MLELQQIETKQELQEEEADAEQEPEQQKEKTLPDLEGELITELYARLIKEDIPIFMLSREEAIKSDELLAYELNRRVSIECAAAIDSAIQANRIATNKYELAQAARHVIDVYGKKRVAWVLEEYAANSQLFSMITSRKILNVFMLRFKEVCKEKIGFKSKLKKATLKSSKWGDMDI